MWLALKRTVCFLRRVGNHSRRAAKDAASRNEFAYRLAPFTLRWMRSLLNRVAHTFYVLMWNDFMHAFMEEKMKLK